MAEPLPPSRPVSLRIPALDLRSKIFPAGTDRRGELQVPRGRRLDQVAWYRHSPTPGQAGPTVLTGHVDTSSGPSVFFRLGDLRPGDRMRVVRADGRRVTFVVRRLKSFAKDDFPTRQVYGGRLGVPAIRLITCSAFDADLGTYAENLVVFADAVRSSPPR